MASTTRANELEQGGFTKPPTGRPVVYATEGVISSGHYLTSIAGMRMLLSGGNAFDALVAAGFAAAVVEPIASYSLAAEGVFMLYHPGSGDLLSLSGQGVAPAAATADFYKSRGHERIPTGPGPNAPLSFTVPGVVESFLALQERYGVKPIGEVLAPAIYYAEHGIPHYEYMLERLDSPSTHQQFDQFPPGGWDVFYQDRQVPQPGAMMVQKGLANTLSAMARSAASAASRIDGVRAARHAFYEGEVAQTIVACSQRVGGILSLEDMANYRAKFEEPALGSFRGYDIWGQGAWTQGPILMQALNMLEPMDLRAMGHNSATYIHTVTEALKLAIADRESYYGDPDYSDIPLQGLLSKDYARERSAMIDANRASPDLPPPGDPRRGARLANGAVHVSGLVGSAAGDGDGAADGTTHVSVLDREGNMVCGTISGGAFGKSVFFPEIGCCLSTRIEMFNCEAGHPNVVEPGKRPRTTLINYLVGKNGKPSMTIGCPGGDNQAQANLQIMLNALVWGMNPQESIEAPRFSSQSFVNSFYPHVHYPGRLDLEAGISESTAEELRAMGHKISRATVCGMGATVSHNDPDTGTLSSGGDPRRACYAIGW